jgi:hypothetical protein
MPLKSQGQRSLVCGVLSVTIQSWRLSTWSQILCAMINANGGVGRVGTFFDAPPNRGYKLSQDAGGLEDYPQNSLGDLTTIVQTKIYSPALFCFCGLETVH